MEDKDLIKLIDERIDAKQRAALYSTRNTSATTHNGLDGPIIPFTALGGVPNSYAGQTGKVLAVNGTETGLEFDTVSATPGGSPYDIQYNDSGVLTGSDKLQWIEADRTVLLNRGVLSNDLAIVQTDDSSASNYRTSTLTVETGESVGSGGIAGDVTLQAGQSNSNAVAGNAIVRAGGNNSSAQAGSAYVYGGDATGTSSGGGNVYLSPGIKSGGLQGDVLVYLRSTHATGDNGGFFVLPTVSGTPTGTPATAGSCIFDTSANKLWVWTGAAWKSVVLT